MSPQIDPEVHRGEPCPDGFHYEWVPENAVGWHSWRVVSEPKQCRFAAGARGADRCESESVAMLNRARSGGREQWWHYCAEHMYGRVVDGRRVWVINTIPNDG